MEPLIAQFVGELNDIIVKYSDQGLTNAEAIGGLEMVKLSVWDKAKESEDEDVDGL